MTAAAPYRHAFAVAPMMDWTDRHCRVFHRLLTRRALLFTEMVTAEAILRGDRQRLLAFDAAAEQPVALQLGGSDPQRLAEAARIGAEFGYAEINLNVGCPSDRVQSGTFGACLMKTPALVGDCIAAMRAAVDVPVTVKCRLGVDEQDTEEALDALADAVFAAGADGLYVHARKAWLQGLSPKENREVPPLDYARVYRLKARLPNRFVAINGGLKTLDDAAAQLTHVDGVMLGRAPLERPALLADVDRRFYGLAPPADALFAAVEGMIGYAEREVEQGTPIQAIVRPMLGLFHGLPGARRWRQILSERRDLLGADRLRLALAAIERAGSQGEAPTAPPLFGDDLSAAPAIEPAPL
ncbi:MAG: tRNA dihydrouridine(20/20a) synthase DusA [Bauldia sp.]